jgi:hypothetical protein
MKKSIRDPDFDMESFVDERIESWRKLADKHLPETDDFITVVLKAHLILEQYLTRLISRYCRVPKYLEAARLTFWQRIQLAKAFVFFPVPVEIWRALELVNQVRNDVAHNLSPSKLAGHIAAVRALPLCAPRDKAQREMLKSDSGVIKFLFGYCSGFLGSLDVLISAMEEHKKESWLWAMEQEKAKAVKNRPNPQPAA